MLSMPQVFEQRLLLVFFFFEKGTRLEFFRFNFPAEMSDPSRSGGGSDVGWSSYLGLWSQ